MPAFSPTTIFRAVTHQQRLQYAGVTNWAHTLRLPKTTFPARASPEDLKTYRQRCADDLYQWQIDNRSSGAHDTFILHDGPPYANGAVHVGHALNKVLKDIILRRELSKGKKVIYQPGWDCHGLPIELKALQPKGTYSEKALSAQDAPKQEGLSSSIAAKLTATEIRSRARGLASEAIEIQKESFRGWGIMADWEHPYTTMEPDFAIRQLGVFREMTRKGLISRHHRPVYWSPSSRTALAEAELEYDDNHRCTAAFVKMPFLELPAILKQNSKIRRNAISALIWTTTPWTLPANQAIAIKDDIEYTVIEIFVKDISQGQVLVAKDRVNHVLSYLPEGTSTASVLDCVLGTKLADASATCLNVFQGTASPILLADFVTATSGTGIVHMAPGHGMEDYQVCQRHGIRSAFAPIDDKGHFTADVVAKSLNASAMPSLVGLNAQSDGVNAVLQALNGPAFNVADEIWDQSLRLLLASHEFIHKNPIDWRTKQPVIVRATSQWFADVSAIKERALASLDSVNFVPDSGKSRLSAFIESRSEWCISRQRAWGVPIPALYHRETGEALVNDESIGHIIAVMAERGTDAWFSDAVDDPLWVHPSLEPDNYIRGTDTMDVWFDSGTTWATLPYRHGQPPSDVYLEGTDQHRGWFQSSLLTAIATQHSSMKPTAPYRTLITHGFTLDGEGRKMSKSVGNIIAPDEIISGTLLPPLKLKKKRTKGNSTTSSSPQHDTLGPDVLRLWVASSDYTRDVSVAVPVLQEVHNILAKLRITFKFLLGVLGDYSSDRALPARDPASFSFADQIILQQLSSCSRTVHDAYEENQFHLVVKTMSTFINNDLSAFYLEICKDRLYVGSNSIRERTQMILLVILKELLQMAGPLVPHLVEEVWHHMPENLKCVEGKSDEHLHPLRQTRTKPFAVDLDLEQFQPACQIFQAVSNATKQAQEQAREDGHLRSGLACKVTVNLHADVPDEFAHFVKQWTKDDELAELLVVSQADIRVVPTSEHSLPETSETPAAWEYVQNIAGPNGARNGEVGFGSVTVTAPDGKKCVRCWRYTAEEETIPCKRCRTVLEQDFASGVTQAA